jgi:antagonist of KipI
MSILLQKAGVMTTVQDLGREGFRQMGINPGGVMDRAAARLINILIGNHESEGVLEIHFPAAEILFESDAVFALGGADFSAGLDGRPARNWRPQFAPKGSVLRFAAKTSGNRAYLAVAGGVKLEKWLGSASTNLVAKLGGFQGRRLEKGDRIFLNTGGATAAPHEGSVSSSLIPRYGRFPTVRITPGAEFDALSATDQQTLVKENFVISANSDRMGYRLHGKPIHPAHNNQIVSSAVNFGTIQLFPDGQLIVLMADHQTSGGYPRVGQVAAIDLPLLAQLGTNDKVAFHMITPAEAEDLLMDFERDLKTLKIGCGLLMR